VLKASRFGSIFQVVFGTRRHPGDRHRHGSRARLLHRRRHVGRRADRRVPVRALGPVPASGTAHRRLPGWRSDGSHRKRIPDTHLDFFGAYGFWEFAAIFIAFALGEALIPPYAQRALAAQNPLSARKGYARAGAFGLVFYFVSASLGIVALVFYPNITPDDAIPTIIINMLPIGIAGLVAASLVAVIMSTADSLLNSASVVLSNDLVKGFIAPNLSGRQLLWVERSSNFLIGFGALLFALNAETIVDALMLTYGLWGPTVVVPFVFAIMSRRRAPVAIVSSMLAGATVAIVWTFVLGAPNDINAIIVALPVNIAVLASTYMLIDRPKNIQTEVGKVVTS
jgi:SSS family solute:Na+ symporter